MVKWVTQIGAAESGFIPPPSADEGDDDAARPQQESSLFLQSADSAPHPIRLFRQLSGFGHELIEVGHFGCPLRVASGNRRQANLRIHPLIPCFHTTPRAARSSPEARKRFFMNWLKSLAVGVLNAGVGLFGAGSLAALCVEWYQIPSFEGESGYFVVFVGLLGIPAGFVVGVVTARIVTTGFFKALGCAVGSTLVLLTIIAGCAWLGADFPPKIDGKNLVIEFEVRCPDGFEIPEERPEDLGWDVFVTADHGSRIQRHGALRVREAKRVDGRWIIPATVNLETSDSGKSLGIALGMREVQYYNLLLPAKPNRSHMDWSEWMPGPTFGDLNKILPEERLAVRYRVQFYIAPPPETPQDEIAAKGTSAE